MHNEDRLRFSHALTLCILLILELTFSWLQANTQIHIGAVNTDTNRLLSTEVTKSCCATHIAGQISQYATPQKQSFIVTNIIVAFFHQFSPFDELMHLHCLQQITQIKAKARDATMQSQTQRPVSSKVDDFATFTKVEVRAKNITF